MQSLATLLLLGTAAAQVFESSPRGPDAFTYIQPENTTILGQYGSSEPIYPSPRMTGAEGWEEAVNKARDFVAELTVEEKAWMVTGRPGPCVGNIHPIPRLNFTGICMHDGPAALRFGDYVSVFPAGVTIASSWDKEMMYDRAFAMGQEFKAKGSNVILGPSTGPMSRSVWSGRNWEGFSPDPYLSGVAMEKSVLGIQDAGVQATAKHWILNEQEIMRHPKLSEEGRLEYESLSSNADDRTVHELYMWPFANAVHAHTASVMCSYQRINGSYGCQNSKTLNGLLKTELGFQGYVMSDWYATGSGVASIEAGLDMDMPGSPLMGPESVAHLEENPFKGYYFGENVTQSVKNGTVEEDRVDDMITRIMAPYYFLGQDEGFPQVDPSTSTLNDFSPQERWIDGFKDWNIGGEASRDVRADHGELIRKHAAASTILLKNEGAALPLKSVKSIAVFGNDAGDVTEGTLNQDPFEYGILSIGGGSGAGRFSYHITPLEAVKARVKKDDDRALVQTWLNNTLISNTDVSTLWNPTPPEACLVFLKGWAAEMDDRETLDLDWSANDVVESVAGRCNNTIVVTHAAGVNDLPFADNANVTAILLAHYAGQEAGNSIVDVLWGDVNPSGHLPYSIAYNVSDYNAPITTHVNTTGADDWQSWFEEKLEIDYRHFDAHDIPVRYEFGHGLSYTTFNMSDLKVEFVGDAGADAVTSAPEDRPIAPGGNPALWETLYEAEITIQNTGSVKGDAVAQLYLTFPDSTPEGTPPLQLRGFDKVEVEPSSSGTAKFELMRRDISYWDVAEQEWLIPSGEFKVSVGFSSRDLREVATFTAVNGDSTA